MSLLELPDREDRRAAETTFDANVVVVAGAGTGKTTLLVERLLYLLLGQGIQAEQVAAVTFTEKAANEMRLRLERELRGGIAATARDADPQGPWAERLERLRTIFHVSNDRVRERIRDALDALPRATIGTIHSLAAQLLRLYPMEAGVAPGFEVDAGTPGPEFERIFAGEWPRWLEEELGEDPRRRRLWETALEAFELERLRELAVLLCRPDVTAQHLAGRLVPKQLPDEVTAWANGLRPALALPCTGKQKKLPVQGQEALQVLDEFLAGRAPGPQVELSKDVGAGPEAMQAAVHAIQGLLDTNDEAVRTAVEVVSPFVERLRARHRQDGFVSFDGLIVFARDLLERHERVRRERKLQIRALLVDEFQDTDPVQQQILLFLAEQPEDHALSAFDARLEPGKLFVVGDPKQSIYRFRGADVEIFTSVRDQVLAQGGVLAKLTTNFRSHAGVLDVVNEAFTRLLAGRRYQAPYDAIEAKPGRPMGPAVEVWRIDPVFDAEDARAVEAVEVARFLQASRETMVLRDERGSEERLKWSDVAILMRAMTSVHTYLDALREHGIPYVVEGEKHFFAAEEVVELVNLLAVIADPNDRIALLGALRTPLFGLTDPEVCDLAERGALDWRRKGPTEAAERAFAMIQRLAARARVEPPSTLVDAIFEETPLLDLLAEGHHGEQRTANVWKVRQLVEEASRRHGGDLAAVVRDLRTSAEEEREEGESPLADETWDAVRVMSIHKAKGLEFGVVIVVNASAKAGQRESKVAAWLDERRGFGGLEVPPAISRTGAWLKIEEAIREEEENRRILYVAMTRARELLVLSGRGKAEGGLGLLAEAFGSEVIDRDGEVAFGKARLACRTIRKTAESPTNLPAPERGTRATDWKPFAERWREREEEARECGSARRHVSPTALDEEGAARGEGRGAKGEGRGEEKTAAEGAAIGPAVGTACHHVLARWDFAKADLARLRDAVAKAVEEIDDLGKERAKVARETEEVLAGFLRSDYAKKLAKAEILGREVPFVLREEDGRIVSGSIDCVYRLAGEVVVADWKTDRTKKPVARHANQARYYLRAIEQAGWGKDVRFELVYLRLGEAVPAP